jgi:hypothetical protein
MKNSVSITVINSKLKSKPKRAECTVSNLNRSEIREIRRVMKKKCQLDMLKDFNSRLKQC